MPPGLGNRIRTKIPPQGKGREQPEDPAFPPGAGRGGFPARPVDSQAGNARPPVYSPKVPDRPPQQTTAPSTCWAQVCVRPLLMPVKGVSSGGVACPERLLPQQAAVPSVRRAQVCVNPLLMAVNRPGGGVDSPCELSPQQTTVPSVLRPQAWLYPLLMAVNFAPSGGAPRSPVPLSQQDAEPSLRNRQEWL